MDSEPNRRHIIVVVQDFAKAKLWLFRFIAAVWIATAIPIVLLSVLLLELPFWPNFSVDSTAEGIATWAVIAAWFYITPIALLIIGRRWNRRLSR